MSQGKFIATRDSMLHTKKVQLATRSKEDFVASWKNMSRHKVQSQQYKATQLCCDKEKLCHNNKSMLLGETLLRQRQILS